jgi:zinc protease
MKPAVKRTILVGMTLAFLGMPAMAQQSVAGQPDSSPQAQQKGTGIVPPGVKLAPEMPGPSAPKQFEFPRAATKTLPNGLRIFVVSDHREPAMAAHLLIMSAGSIKDPAGMPGVAEMTARLLTEGTEKRSAETIANAIDFVGGTLDASAGDDETTVTLSVVKKDLGTGLDLMSDVVLHPAFQAEELDRQRQQLLSDLTVQYSDPEYLASVVFDRVVYGSSPYGWPGEGTPETVKKLSRDALAKFHDANYAPNESLLVLAGDIAAEDAFAVAEKYFGSWPKRDAGTSAPSPPAAPAGHHIWLIDKPDAVQTQIRVGRLGIRRADPDYIPVVVTNRIFGGGFNSRLNTEVRVKKGLTYGASSSFSSHRFAGAFEVSTFTRTEATVEATRLVVDLISKMSTGEVTPAEMDFARDYLSGVYPIQSETAEQVADRVLTVAAFDLPEDYNSTYPSKIRRVTSAEVRAMSEKYLGVSDLDIVLVGNVAAFRAALRKEFPNAQYEEIPFEEVDVLAGDLRKPKERAAAVTPESLIQGKEILLAAAKAAGGDALASVSALSMTESGQLSSPSGNVPIHVKWVVSYPDRSRADVTLGQMDIVQGCDGKSAWIQAQSQMSDASQMMGEFERGISLFGGGWGLYQQILAGKTAGPFIGEQEIDGKKTLGVALEAAFGPLKLFFDPSTHLLVAARYQSMGPGGASDSEQRWSDYRTVEGRHFAFSTVTFRDGVKFAETTIEDFLLNPHTDDSLFREPSSAGSK